MKPLDHTVGLRMEGGGMMDVGSQQNSQLRPQGRRELRPSVRSNLCRGSKPRNPSVEEGPRQTQRRRVVDRKRLRPTRETIDDREKMGKSLGRRQGPDNVDVYVVETMTRCCKVFHWGLNVASDLALLARNAGVRPRSRVGVEAWPNELGSEEATCCPDARMREGVAGVENWTSERRWNEGPGNSGGDVTEKTPVPHDESLHLQPRPRILLPLPYLSVNFLCLGHVVVVDAVDIDGENDAVVD